MKFCQCSFFSFIWTAVPHSEKCQTHFRSFSSFYQTFISKI